MSKSPPAALALTVGQTPLRVWALPSTERLRRQFERAGAATDERGNGRVALLRADWVYDDAIVRGLVQATEDVALMVDDECIAVNLPAARTTEAMASVGQRSAPPLTHPRNAGQIAGSYNDTLRKKEPPYLMRLTPEALPVIEKRVFGGAYKGVTDIVTLYLWPAPARLVTRWCANLGITPNQVTTASLLLVLAATWLFWNGHYAWGLAAAWPMTFLDTVDGKLARVTVSSTAWGNVFDHGIDLIHPPFWWWAWIVGLPAAGLPFEYAALALWVIVGGYLLQRIEEGIFIAAFKMEMHVWTRFDSLFRLVTARRNPNLIILTVAVLAGRPDIGIAVVAIWVALCLVVHALRIVQAALARRHGPLQSWLAA